MGWFHSGDLPGSGNSWLLSAQHAGTCGKGVSRLHERAGAAACPRQSDVTNWGWGGGPVCCKYGEGTVSLLCLPACRKDTNPRRHLSSPGTPHHLGKPLCMCTVVSWECPFFPWQLLLCPDFCSASRSFPLPAFAQPPRGTTTQPRRCPRPATRRWKGAALEGERPEQLSRPGKQLTNGSAQKQSCLSSP